jgi:hypothetical protein
MIKAQLALRNSLYSQLWPSALGPKPTLGNTTTKLPFIRYPLPTVPKRAVRVRGPYLERAIVFLVNAYLVSRNFYLEV